MSIESSHLNLNFENESQEQARLAKVRQHWEEKDKLKNGGGDQSKEWEDLTRKIRAIEAEIVRVEIKKKKLSETLFPDSLAIQEFDVNIKNLKKNRKELMDYINEHSKKIGDN